MRIGTRNHRYPQKGDAKYPTTLTDKFGIKCPVVCGNVMHADSDYEVVRDIISDCTVRVKSKLVIGKLKCAERKTNECQVLMQKLRRDNGKLMAQFALWRSRVLFE